MASEKAEATGEKQLAASDVSGDASIAVEELTAINESKLIRKLDLRLLPAVTSLYLVSFLDRSNGDNQYLDGLTLFFVGYVIFEVPWNIVLKRTTPKFWLPTLTVIFGVVTVLQGIIQNAAGFLAVRFFLGFAEAGIFPGVVFYLSMWYPRKERQFRVAMFFSAAAFSGAFGGILAYGIAHMDGVAGLGGWRWIFILEGILTVLVGLFAYLFIVNYPSTARFLKPAEKEFVKRRLAADGESDAFSWSDVRASLADTKVWLYAWGYHFQSLCLYTLALFLPTIIEDLGYSAAAAQLLTIPPYALATLLTAGLAWFSERVGYRAPFMIGCSVVAIVGYIILLTNTDPTGRPGVSYVGTFFAAAGIYPGVGLMLSWPAVNVGGQTKRAVANGLQISIGNCGAVIGTQIYRTADAPRFIVGHSVALGYCVVSACLTSFTWWYLARENRRREAEHPDSGVVGGAGDMRNDNDPRWRFLT